MTRRFAPLVDWVAHEGGNDPWALHWEARNALDRGEDVIVLSVGDPDLDTPPAVVDAAVKAMRAGDTHYTESIGRPALRAAIAAMHTARTGQVVTAANTAVLAGTQNGLFVSSLCLAGHGEEVIALDPMYTTYPAAIGASGATLVRVPAPASAGFHPDLAALEAAGSTLHRCGRGRSQPGGRGRRADALRAAPRLLGHWVGLGNITRGF